MSRSARLLGLLQALRRYRRPVSGRVLAAELQVSLRTLYRDIAALVAQGAPIAGEAGVGYVLRPGFLLPPLMFSAEEIEALVLGMRWVERRGDPALAKAAGDALAKIAAILPSDLREEADSSGLMAASFANEPGERIDLAGLRRAIRAEHKIRIDYVNAAGIASKRVVWPIALAFFDRVRILAAWCELRQDFRHFRTDRIAALAALGARYPRRRRALLKEWRTGLGLAEPPWSSRHAADGNCHQAHAKLRAQA
ncbi:MAG TPA: YafY family protein [Stellaceae bacterium]|nr:YafY family protein [Stellaceae bacterium]